MQAFCKGINKSNKRWDMLVMTHILSTTWVSVHFASSKHDRWSGHRASCDPGVYFAVGSGELTMVSMAMRYTLVNSAGDTHLLVNSAVIVVQETTAPEITSPFLFCILRRYLYVALVVPELTIQTRLSGNSQRATCLFLLSAGFKGVLWRKEREQREQAVDWHLRFWASLCYFYKLTFTLKTLIKGRNM